MPREAPIIVGTSLLDKNGKAQPYSPKNLAPYSPSSLAPYTPVLTPYTGLPSPAPTASPTPYNPASTPAAVTNAGATDRNAAKVALAAAAAKTISQKKNGQPGSPTSFAAALKMVQKAMGGFNSSAYDMAIGNARRQANVQSGQARRQGARAQADDAVLYGHLKNYVKGILGDSRQANVKLAKTAQAGFQAAKNAINSEYGATNKQSNEILSGRGIAEDQFPAENTRRFEQSQVAANRGSTMSNLRSNAYNANNILRQRMADAVITGTGKVASEKAAVGNTLSGIAAALSNQLAGINEQRATASNAYNTSLRSQALNAMQSQAANDPNSPENVLRRAEAAQAIANANRINTNSAKGPTSASTKRYDLALGDLAQMPTAHQGTLTNLFNQIITGKGPFQNQSLPATPTDNITLGKIMDLVNQQIQGRKGQGYGAPDEQAIQNALLAFMGLGS